MNQPPTKQPDAEAEALVRLAALEWDVDIPSETAHAWANNLVGAVNFERQKWKSEKVQAAKHDKQYGTDHLDDYEDEWNADHLLRTFLRDTLGSPAYFDDREQFVPSEYFTQHGKAYRPMENQNER